MTNNELVWIIFLLPLSSFLINGILITFTKFNTRAISGPLNVLTIGLSFLICLFILINGIGSNFDYQSGSFQWFSFGLFEITMGILLDPLTLIMITVVTGISFLIQIYSLAYMEHDEGYSRYFTYMALFTTSMLGLVFSKNLIQLFIFWELVGATSYLLIGFWFNKQSAIKAAKKAFLMTRIGDFGLIIGILLIAKQGSQYLDITQFYIAVQNGIFTTEILTLIGLLVVIGAIGKSAQFPLHNWLPDAMEGPTPVSALLHSATMVTAGVFLIARMFPLISAIEIVSSTVAYIGGFTLIFASTMALVSNDIKRVLAYSSISQLGYMFLALGTGAYGAAILHLFTHAWFKALLFLGAGSVGHAVHTFDMTKMGGLKDHMKITYWTMMLSAISLIGIFPFSGFWSKDEVLLGVSKDSNILFLMGLFGVILTGFYMTRMMLMTFFGDFKGGESGIEEKSLHESPKFMIYPMIILAIPSVIIGFFVSSPIDLGIIDKHMMVSFLDHNKLVFPDLHHHEIKFNFLLAIVSSLLALSGILIAIFTSRSKIDLKFARKILENKYYLDYLYEEIITENLFYRRFVKLLDYIETNFIDKASHILSNSLKWASNKFAITQNGQLQIQSITFFIGLLIIITGYFSWLYLGGN